MAKTIEEIEAFVKGDHLRYHDLDELGAIWVFLLLISGPLYFIMPDLFIIYMIPVVIAVILTIVKVVRIDEFQFVDEKLAILHKTRIFPVKRIDLQGLEQVCIRHQSTGEDTTAWYCYLEYSDGSEVKLFENDRSDIIDFSAAISMATRRPIIFREYLKNKFSMGTYELSGLDPTIPQLLQMFHESDQTGLDKYQCHNCGSSIVLDGNACPRCSTIAPICVVCFGNPYPHASLSILLCCNSYAHTNHIRTWLQIKWICPYCRSEDPKLNKVTEINQL